MYNEIKALEQHINALKQQWFSEAEAAGKVGHTDKVIKTVKAYQGEIADVKKISAQQPAVYITVMDAQPVQLIPEANVDLIIVTSTKHFAKDANSAANILLTQRIAEYLSNNSQIRYGSDYYSIDTETLTARPLLIDNEYTITTISLRVVNLK